MELNPPQGGAYLDVCFLDLSQRGACLSVTVGWRDVALTRTMESFIKPSNIEKNIQNWKRSGVIPGDKEAKSDAVPVQFQADQGIWSGMAVWQTLAGDWGWQWRKEYGLFMVPSIYWTIENILQIYRPSYIRITERSAKWKLSLILDCTTVFQTGEIACWVGASQTILWSQSGRLWTYEI